MPVLRTPGALATFHGGCCGGIGAQAEQDDVPSGARAGARLAALGNAVDRILRGYTIA